MQTREWIVYKLVRSDLHPKDAPLPHVLNFVLFQTTPKDE